MLPPPFDVCFRISGQVSTAFNIRIVISPQWVDSKKAFMEKKKLCEIKWFGIQLGIFAIYLLAACATYHFYLTNEFTPGGDGPRHISIFKIHGKSTGTFSVLASAQESRLPLDG